MIERSTLFQWIFTRWRDVLAFTVWSVIILLYYNQHVYLGYFILFCLSCVKIKPVLPDVIKIAKNVYVIKFYNIIIWFVAYTVSLKILSYQTGIVEEHLKFSPVVMALPLSIVIVFTLIMVMMALMQCLLHFLPIFSTFMTVKLRSKLMNSRYYQFAVRSFYIIPVIIPFMLSVAYASGPFFKIALLADSSFVSDCGAKQKDKMYLRIDSHSCMVSTLDRNIFNASPEVIISEEK